MTSNDGTRSEYAGERGPNYIKPDRRPRGLSVGERAAVLRREGMNPGSPYGPSRRTGYDPRTNPDPGSQQIVPGFRRD